MIRIELLVFTIIVTLYCSIAYAVLAPNGAKDVSLAGPQQWNVGNDVSWGIYSPTATGVYKTMSTATNAGVWKPIPQDTWIGRDVNAKSKFLRISGARGGFLERGGR